MFVGGGHGAHLVAEGSPGKGGGIDKRTAAVTLQCGRGGWMTKSLSTGPAKDRIEQLDALRGLALFGILLANILYWSGWVLVTDAERQAMATPAEQLWQYRFHHLLVDGKFYTLFSFLFGLGFALQLDRLERRGADGIRIYRRRVLVLLGIGLIHSLVIWDGDILTLYALLGLLLPLFRGLSDPRLLLWAAALIFLVPIVGVSTFTALGWHPERSLYGLSDAVLAVFGWRPGADIALRLLPVAAPGDVVVWNLSGTPFSWGLRIESWRIPKVLGIMILGMWAGRRLASGQLLADRRLLWRVFGAGLAIGGPLSLAYALVPKQDQTSLWSMLGTVPLALAYAAGFALSWPKLQRGLGLFAAPGRMALTNYLTHSLLGALIFYGIGLGLIGRLSPPEFYAVALLIFASQILLSRWWLRRRSQGPMEALWRRLTYGSPRRHDEVLAPR